MSTSNPGALVLENDTAGPAASEFSALGALPQGVPDPVVLARMANEFFTALPNSLDVPVHSIPTDIAQTTSDTFTPPATAPAFQPEVQLPSDQHLPTLPASIGPTQVPPVSAPVQAAPPAVPGAAASTLGELTTESYPFSFLQEARPIFSPGSAPTASYPPAAPIGSFASQASTPTTGFSMPGAEAIPANHSHAAKSFQPPSIGTGPFASAADLAPVPVFSFLEELRPLFTDSPSIPGPVPAGPENELTDDILFGLDLPHDFDRSPDLTNLADKSTYNFFSSRPLEPSQLAVIGQPLNIEQDVPRALDLTAYPFDAETIKRDFPILRERVNGRPLVWLDNAATTQKPQSVIDRLAYFYEHENSNVHRAAHELAARATDAYESAREKVRRFVNAPSTREIIFVRGATEGINLIAQAWGRRNIRKDDEIVITWLEHHANIVPWQMLCSETGAKLRVAPVDDTGQILLDEYEKLLGPRTRLVSLTQVSNALGVVTPAAEMIETAHRYGAKVLLDGAQSVSHMRVDVQSLDCDFFVFSGHKVFGPTGIGVVYGKPDVLESMQPWQGGGNMIQDVTFAKTIFHGPPQRFEAGTGNIADAVGLGAAIDYLDRIGMPNISRHERGLLECATAELMRVPGLHIIGTAKEKAGVISFILDGFKTEEVGARLNQYGIAVRSGHHCAQPILRRFDLESTVRASLALYNTHEDIDLLVRALFDLRVGRGSVA